jgi:hypothetical protein
VTLTTRPGLVTGPRPPLCVRPQVHVKHVSPFANRYDNMTAVRRLATPLSKYRRLSTIGASVDDPSTSRPQPVARTAPSAPAATAHEDVGVGQSELLLETSEKVTISLEPELITGLGNTRHQIHRWTWASRTDGKRPSDAQDEPLPGH